MDFRTCPACKASVLEDDVAECPFCGASMSGKPKPTAPKPVAPSAPAPAAKGPAKPAAPASPAAPAKPGGAVPPRRLRTDPEIPQEDPFDVDTTAVRRAVKLAPKATKQRTHEVVCPMCETHGFMAPEDAGKDVQCCNPECIVPVFKSKRLVVKEAAPEAPPRNWTLLIGGGVAVLAILGGAAWFLMKGPAEKKLVIEPLPKIDDEKPQETLVPKNVVQMAQAAPAATAAEIRQQSLQRIVEIARKTERNRNLDFGTQLSAETFAVAGDLAQAQQALSRLQSRSQAVSYFQILPLVEIGWQQLRSGDETGLKKSIDDALALTTNLPKTVRKTHDSVMSLAALMIAAGRTTEAEPLIGKYVDFDLKGELSVLWRCALESKSFNLQQESEYPWHAAMPDPLRVGIVETLVLRGQGNKALEYVNTLTGRAAHDAALAAWAGRMLLTRAGDAATLSAEFLKPGVSPAGQCQAWSALAAGAATLGDADGAQNHLAEAVKLLEGIPPGTPLPIPGMKALYDNRSKPFVGLPDPGPAHSQALAALQVAVAQLKLNHREAAWPAFQKACELARGMTPGPAATQKLVDDNKQQEPLIQSQLAVQLRISNDDARLPFSEYRRYCNSLDAEADNRMALQGRFLKRAVLAGLLNEVAAFVQQADSAAELNLREPYLASPEPIASFLSATAQAEGNTDVVAQLTAAAGDRKLVVDRLDTAIAQARHFVAQGQAMKAVDILKPVVSSNAGNKQPDKVDAVFLLLLGKLQPTSEMKDLISYIQALPDAVVQEDAFLLLAGTAAQRGFAPELWKFIADSHDLEQLEIASMYRGFVTAIPAE